MWISMSIGVAIGAAVGVAIDHVAQGVAIGVALGAAVGAAMIFAQPKFPPCDAPAKSTRPRGALMLVLAVLCLVLGGLAILFFLEEKPIVGTNSTKPSQSSITPPAGLVELKLKWPPDKCYVADHDFKQNTALLLQGRSNTVKEDYYLGKSIGAYGGAGNPDGGHELQLEFLSARMGIKLGDDTILDYDSAHKSAPDPTNGVAAVFGKVVGSKLRYFLNSSNDAERLEGVGDLVQRIQSVPQTDPLTGDMKNMYNAAFFEELTNASPFLPRQRRATRRYLVFSSRTSRGRRGHRGVGLQGRFPKLGNA